MAGAEAQAGFVEAIDEDLHGIGDFLLKTLEAVEPLAVDPHTLEMAGQHKFRLDE